METPSELSDEETAVGLKYILRQGLAGHAMGTLAGGIFIVKIALIFGAPLFVIGLLAALPALAQLGQIPGVYLIEKYRNRKRITMLGLGAVRLCILAIALVALAVAPTLGLSLLLILIVLQGAFGALGGSAWNSWVRDVVPEDRMGTFFSQRQRLSMLLGVPLSLGAALFLDGWYERYPGLELESYSLLFFAGFAIGLVGLYCVVRTPEPRLPPTDGRTNFGAVLAEPFRDENFRQLIRFLGAWNFAIALAAPFFTVYILVRLDYGMPVVIGLTVLSQLTNAAFAGIWGRLSDAYSNKAVLGVSGPLVLVSLLGWLFTAMPSPHSLTLALLVGIHVLLGMAMSGVSLASGNIGMKLAPRGRATAYLAATSLVGSIASGIGPILGGIVANALAEHRVTLTLGVETPDSVVSIPTLHLTGIDFAFVLAFGVGIYAVHRLTAVVEEGVADRSAVAFRLVDEVRRPLVNFTTVGGFSQMVTFPVTAVRRASQRGGSRATDESDADDPGASSDDPQAPKDSSDDRPAPPGDSD